MIRTHTAAVRVLQVALLVLVGLGPASAATCTAESGAQRTALLELYTSEGCNSCPPTDRWVSTLPSLGLSADRLVVLGFHVDYWNDLGWPDPFAHKAYSERQREGSRRNGARFVYTPQLLLNGKDYRRGLWRDTIAERVASINREKPGVVIRLHAAAGNSLELPVRADISIADSTPRERSELFIAMAEDQLETEVTAGENRGRRLRHDFVVRALAGPFPLAHAGQFAHRFRIDPRWKRSNLSLAAFVQDRATGTVLQALKADCWR